MADVIVAGGGIGGLCAAISCAARGHAVRLLEASSSLGGKAGRVTIDGVACDTGPSVLTLPEVFDEVLRLAGAPPLQLVRPPRWFRHRWADGTTLELGNGLQGTLDGVQAALGTGPRDELARFLERAKAMWEVAAPRFVWGEAPGVRSLLRKGAFDLRAIRPFTRLWDFIREEVREPHLQALLARYATYAGSDARRAPAVLGTIAWVELGLGGHGVHGGISALVDRLLAAAQALGVSIQTRAEVAGIRVRGDQAIGVTLADGRLLDAEALVLNADARAVFTRLLPREHRRPLAGEPSYSGRCYVFRARTQDRPAHETAMPARYLDELDQLARGQAPSDPTITVSAPRVAHAAPSWTDTEPLFVMVNAPPLPESRSGDRLDPDEAPLAEAVRARLQALGVLDPRAGLVWSRGVTALAQAFPDSQGSIYGQASHSWRTAFARPANRLPWIRGLYLAGGSAHPGAGLPLVASSGLRAAEALDQDLRPARRRPAGAAVLALAAVCATASGVSAAEQGVSAAEQGDKGTPSPSTWERAQDLLQESELHSGNAKAALALVASEPAPDSLVAAAEASWRVADEAKDQRERAFDEAVRRARLAVAAAPQSAGAWFWLGMSLTSLGRERGLRAMIKVADEIRAALHRAEALDPLYEDAAPLSALCSMYHHAPGWPLSFGDRETSRRYCLRVIDATPRAWEAHLVLAQQARAEGRFVDARRHLAAILDGPLDERTPLTHQRYRREAQAEEERL
ncbi:MAG: FAD-dependent oxidoreductase [Deltaproteobacteria bacterium]|nr:FAD-dependent oxidoreductase [Deltaproteobacteria bacterium]